MEISFEKMKEKAKEVGHKIKEKAEDAIDWVKENPSEAAFSAFCATGAACMLTLTKLASEATKASVGKSEPVDDDEQTILVSTTMTEKEFADFVENRMK